ncbi:MAG: TolC family protein [Deltaproteobacteria bacterium]|nr:TolC family protein [Deltaproteobacteria bacterium]
MRLTWSRTIAGLLAVAFSPCAEAQETPAGPMRWADVVRRIDLLPHVRQAVLRAEAAEAGVAAAGQIPNPEFETRLGRGRPRGQGDAGLEWGLGVTIPFDWLGPRAGEVRAVRAEADSTRLDAVHARNEVLGRLAALYWRLVYDRHLVSTLEETESQVARLAGLVRLRVEKGEARPTEVPRIETDLERVRLDLARARSADRADRRTFAVLLDVPEPGLLVAKVELGPRRGAGDLEPTVFKVMDRHPGLAAAQARVSAGQAQVSAERARRVPAFSVGAFYDRDLDKDSVGGLVQVKLPLWNWNSAAIRRAEADASAHEQSVEAAARDLRAEVATAWERCVQGQDTLDRFRQEIVPRAEATSRAVEKGFEAGEMTIVEVLDARRVLLDVRKEQLAASLEARTDCVALEVLTGDIGRVE